MKKPNISLKSNVYIVDTNYPFDDSNFIDKLSDLKALEKICSLRIGTVRLNDWQHDLLKRGMACSVHDECERPFGLVAKDEGHVFECRCSIIENCPHASRGKCRDIYRG